MSDKYAGYRRQWMRENSDRITAPIECECGKTVPKNNLHNHKQTTYHVIAMQKNEEIDELREQLELYKKKNKRLRKKIIKLTEEN